MRLAACLFAALAILPTTFAVDFRTVRQLVVVQSDNWDAHQARVRRFERTTEGRWRETGAPVAAVVGRAGFGVSPSAVAEKHAPGPEKKEGDGRSPAGLFAITRIFGAAPQTWETVERFRLPYSQITDDLECVDDAKSKQYNKIVRRSAIPAPDWSSSEKVADLADGAYHWFAEIGANPEPRPGGGSCIFLHVISPQKTPTAGCTALAEDDLVELFIWLDPQAQPYVLQGPTDYLRRARLPRTLAFDAKAELSPKVRRHLLPHRKTARGGVT